MKKMFRKITAVFMIVLMMFSCCSVAFAETASNGVSFDVVYDKNGNRVGFKTITIKDKVYYDVFGGQNTLDGMNVGDFYKTVLTKRYNWASLLNRWSYVADNVFRIGGKEFGYNWEFEDYDKWYNTNKTDTTSSNPSNADIGLQTQLSQTEPYSSGELEDYCVRATGLQLHSSLNNVQNAMLEQIVDVCGERDVATAFKKVVLDFCTGDSKGLKLLQDTSEQPVLAHIVTNQYNCGGQDLIDLTTERYFSSFGIAFYDFELTPIVKENLEYISAADDYDSVEDAFKSGAPGVTYKESSDGMESISYIQNPTAETASVGVSTSKSASYSISNSFTESDSYSFSESIGTEFEGGISGAVKMKVGIDFSTSQAISTAYSESSSVSESVSTSSSVNVNLPPYTEVGIKQSSSKVEQSVEYNCPVYVTYKVAIFGLNAQYYQDKGTGSWSTADYDQGSICVGFGSDASIGGVNAPENLYNRIKENSPAFEISYGNVSGYYEDQEDGHDSVKLTYIDWKSPKAKHDLTEYAEELVNYVPMSSMGGKMIAKTDSFNTELTQIYPMYDLKRIRFEGNGAYTLGIGGKLDLNTVNTVGLNEFDRPYYGFLGRMGTWYVCDENGNDITFEEGKGISLEPTPSTQTIIAHEIGDYYVRFDIDEHFYTKASDRVTYITNDDLEFTAILKLSVTDTGNNHTCRPGGWITYIPANCVVEGERYKNCLTCSKRMATEVIPKTDHIHVETVVPATCNTDGSKTTSCETCKAVLAHEVIPAKGHGSTYSVTTVAPTCIRDGEKAIYCYDCNMLIGSETIASTGHINSVWKIDFEATPEHEGQMTKYCTTCNFALESKTFAYHTHSYTAWCMNGNGTHTRVCYLCNFKETANCDYNDTVTPETCTTDGKITHQCKDCSHKYTEITSYATGHVYQNGVCINCGKTASGISVPENSSVVIDKEKGLISGLDMSLDKDGLMQYLEISDDVTLSLSTDIIGTGTVITIADKVSRNILETYTAVIFGDYNGDGVADSEDTAYFSSISNFEIFDYLENEYLFMAADVNGDGVVDGMDEEDMNAVANYEAYIDHTITSGSKIVRY